jgi:hypothetical protein
MRQELLSALFQKWAGRPILVIGGGPSVLADLPRLDIEPACVISANEHGFKQKRFKVDLVVSLDRTHCLEKRPMAEILKPYGVPLVNRYSWADYRIPEWTLAGNSGMAAVGVAAALGGNPVIVTGIDMFAGGRRYFHDAGVKAPKDKGPRILASKRHRLRLMSLVNFCKGANIRPMSGPMQEFFPKYDPKESFPACRPVAYRTKLEREKPLRVLGVRSFTLFNGDAVHPDNEIVITQRELEVDNRLRCSVKIL